MILTHKIPNERDTWELFCEMGFARSHITQVELGTGIAMNSLNGSYNGCLLKKQHEKRQLCDCKMHSRKRGPVLLCGRSPNPNLQCFCECEEVW